MKKTVEPEALLRKLFPPMLATLVSSSPKQEAEWILELKYDGFRCVSALVGGRIAMWTRNGLDLTTRFPAVAQALEEVDVAEAVLDGEVVVLDAAGAPRFQLIQQGKTSGTVYFVFDLLWLNGHDLRATPLEQRRELLEELMKKVSKKSRIRLSEQIEDDPQAALAWAASKGYEGLIAKLRGSVYENRRSKTWLKLKAINAQELAVVGFTASNHSDDEIGSLLLGVIADGVMRFAGKVGTGFSALQREELKRDLSRDAVREPTAAGAPRMRDATWVEPRLVAQVQFTEWTADGKLRHPSFLGFRPDKTPAECVREVPRSPGADDPKETRRGTSRKKTASTKIVPEQKPRGREASPQIILTKPDRLLYPRDGITKKDVAEYYSAVSEAMTRALRDRPLALEHWNDGIDKPSWFQQDLGRQAEPWMKLVDTPTRTSKRTVRHLVADTPVALQWLAQHSVLTAHMWSSRAGSLETPDWLILDLDPAKGETIQQAVETALVLRRLFESLELPSVPKTSGKRGIHLLVPLAPRYTHEEAVEFACHIAQVVSSKLPFATVERSIPKRGGRLYLDCLQNGYGKTIVAPYSLRALDGAPVSAPLQWSEVTKRLDPSRFNLRTMPDRLAKLGDLFAPALEGGVALPRFR